MDVLAKFAQLDQSNRRHYRIFWIAAGGPFGDIKQVTDELLEASFQALDRFGAETPEMKEADTGGASLSACTVIRRAIEDRPDQRDALLKRLVSYYYHPNILVSSAAVRALERSDTCSMLARPYLENIAAADHTIRSAEGLPLRGLAWYMLYKLDPSVEFDAGYRAAQQDATHLLRHWANCPGLASDRSDMSELAQRLEERNA
jgi:hypothetical protein